MAVHFGETFTDKTINIDDETYTNCKFIKCNIIYSGGALPSLKNNSFDGCNFSLSGPAQRTLIYLKGLYSGGASELVEQVISAIKS